MGHLRKGTRVRYELTNHETWCGDGTLREGIVRDFLPEDHPNAFLTGEHYVVEGTDGPEGRAPRTDSVWPKEVQQVHLSGGWAPWEPEDA